VRERVARFGEQLEIAHRLLHEERVDFEGTYYKLTDAPGLHRPELTLLVGGSAKPGTARPAARFADEYNALFGTLDELRERKQLLDEACERAGRDPATLRYSVMAPCVIGRDEEEVLASARRIASRFGQSPEDVLARHREHGPVGTIAEAVERLKQIEKIGYERVMLQHLAHDDLETVALIGRELVPAVA
jgi:alkanesulfonate monooxygenase SsuD/methylene tetrahydromethanopterin reductase-like flavin-dependent oxidoreductase (luciferase family)